MCVTGLLNMAHAINAVFINDQRDSLAAGAPVPLSVDTDGGPAVVEVMVVARTSMVVPSVGSVCGRLA